MKINDPHTEFTKENRSQICCRIPYSLKKDIEKYATANERTVSNLASILIKLGFKEYTKNIPEDLLL